MKLSQLDARAKADAGVEMQLCHHKTGKPLFDGDKPLIAIVKGSDARLDADAMRAGFVAMKAAKPDEDGNILVDALHQGIVLRAIPYIAGFRNVELENGEPATAADAYAVLDLTKWRSPTDEEPGVSFAQQVLAFVAKADAELGNA